MFMIIPKFVIRGYQNKFPKMQVMIVFMYRPMDQLIKIGVCDHWTLNKTTIEEISLVSVFFLKPESHSATYLFTLVFIDWITLPQEYWTWRGGGGGWWRDKILNFSSMRLDWFASKLLLMLFLGERVQCSAQTSASWWKRGIPRRCF